MGVFPGTSFGTLQHHIRQSYYLQTTYIRDPEDKPEVDQKIYAKHHCDGFLQNQARFSFLFSFAFTCNATPVLLGAACSL